MSTVRTPESVEGLRVKVTDLERSIEALTASVVELRRSDEIQRQALQKIARGKPMDLAVALAKSAEPWTD